MKPRFLSPLTLLALSTLSLGTLASALTLSGTVEGAVTPDTRIGAWAVKVSGQPVQEVVSSALNADGSFSLTLPAAAPSTLYPIDDRIAWPGLLDFGKATANAQASELKFFVYRDSNGNGNRDESEPLNEVRVKAGKGLLFVTWASGDVSVLGSNGYQADLKQGWNALDIDVRNTVTVKPHDSKLPVQIRLGK